MHIIGALGGVRDHLGLTRQRANSHIDSEILMLYTEYTSIFLFIDFLFRKSYSVGEVLCR